MIFDVVFLIGNSLQDSLFEKYAGPQRLATELRTLGYKVFVQYGLNYYSTEELIHLLNYTISDKTLCLGLSTTFLIGNPVFENKGDRTEEPKYLKSFRDISTHFKKQYKNLKIIVGGANCKEKITNVPVIDAYFNGYSDVTFINYIKQVQNKKVFLGQQTFTESNGDEFDFKHKGYIQYTNDDLMFENEALPIELSRGCIFKCKYCDWPNIGKSVKDTSWLKSSQVLIDELTNNYEKYGTTNYLFVDDTYNAGIDKVKYYTEALLKLPFKINYSAYIRIDLLYRFPEMVYMLKESGITGAFFGFETFNPTSAKIIGKGLSIDKQLKALELCHKVWGEDIVMLGSFIYGLPKETESTMRDWTEKIILNSGLFDNLSISLYPLMLTNLQKRNKLYTSELERDALKYNYRWNSDPSVPNYVWENDDTTFYECWDLFKEMTAKINLTKRPWGALKLPALYGYGLSKDEVRDIKSSRKKINEVIKDRYNRYKLSIESKFL